jgi:hypothetical protein
MKKYNWNICGDLKGIAVLFGLQFGYTSFVAFCVGGRVGRETSLYPNPVA